MYYLKRHINGVMLKSEEKEEILQIGMKQYINNLCLDYLATFDGRRKAISRLLRQNNNIPIYINDEVFVYPTKSLREYDMVFINYHSVLSYKRIASKKTKIIFENFDELIINISIKKVIKQHERIKYIIQYIENNT